MGTEVVSTITRGGTFIEKSLYNDLLTRFERLLAYASTLLAPALLVKGVFVVAILLLLAPLSRYQHRSK